MNRTELIAAVREHALANYEQGWDVVVETYEDDEIATVIGKARTGQDAVDKMAKAIEPYNERRREIQSLADDEGLGSMVAEAIAFAEKLAALPPMSLAEEEFSPYPRNTETGPVCGNCTHYDGAGDRVIMRHATAQDVRDCYAVRYAEEQEALAKLEAEPSETSDWKSNPHRLPPATEGGVECFACRNAGKRALGLTAVVPPVRHATQEDVAECARRQSQLSWSVAKRVDGQDVYRCNW